METEKGKGYSVACICTSASSSETVFLSLLAGHRTLHNVLGLGYSSSDIWSRRKQSVHAGWLRVPSPELTWNAASLGGSREKERFKLLPERVCSLFQYAFQTRMSSALFSFHGKERAAEES